MSNKNQEEMCTDNNIKKQAEILLSQIITDNVKITLPIKKMFEIRTYVILQITRKRIIRLKIEASNCTLLENEELSDAVLFDKCLIFKDTTDELDLNDIIELIKNVNKTLKNLKFDRLTGEFVELDDDKKLDIDFWNCLIPNCDYIESIFDNCCVCLELTGTELKCCKKKLCIQCWDKLKSRYCNECNGNFDADCETECCGHKSCPCCRKSITNQEVFNEELFD